MRFQKRKKYQRIPTYIPMFCFEDRGQLVNWGDDPKIRRREVIGNIVPLGSTFRIQNPIEGSWHEAERLAVTMKDGTIVPAYRLTGANYVVSQDYGRVPIKKKPA